MAIPDKRFCFDYARELTSLARVIDAMGNKIHTKGTVAEYYLKVVKRGEQIAWDITNNEVISNVHTLQDAKYGMNKVVQGQYVDVHAWVFTPESFRDIMSDLVKLGFISLEEVGFFDTEGHEFFISYKKRKS